MTIQYPLGRVVEHDERSRAFSVAPRAVAPLVMRNWYHYGPVLNQLDTSSCTGHALSQALNTKPLHVKKTHLFTHDDALAIYSRATVLDEFPGEYPPEDKGSSGLAVCKAALEKGLISRYEHAFGIDQTIAALMLQPVITGTAWYSGMFTPNAAGFVKPTGDVVGGHEYCLLGVNVNKGYVTAINSWGKEWGIKGKFKITFDDFHALLEDNGDVTVPIR